MPWVPTAGPDDPILSGGWRGSNGWVWWVWVYESGWEEWVPSRTMIQWFVDHGFRNTMMVGIPDLARVEDDFFIHLHNRFVGPLRANSHDHFVMISDMGKYMEDNGDKSKWYYDTIPAYHASYLA